MTLELPVRSTTREEMIDLTSSVSEAVRRAGLTEGTVTVFVPHTTAGVTIQEHADPDVAADLLRALSRIVPRDGGYAHAEGNSDAHIKSTLVGSSVQVLVEQGRLRLGTWQGIFFCEFDGPRSRRVWLSLAGVHG